MTNRKPGRAVLVLAALAIGTIAVAASPVAVAANPLHGAKSRSMSSPGAPAHRASKKYRPHVPAGQPQMHHEDPFLSLLLG